MDQMAYAVCTVSEGLRPSEATVEVLDLDNMAICQLIFEEVHGTPEKGYQGLFTHQGPD
jgi:hypothetical protein